MKAGHIAAYGMTLVVMGMLPILAHAAIVPACEGPTCNFTFFIKLIKNIMSFLLMIAVPLFAILFSWAGFLMVTAAGNMTQIGKAKSMMTTAFIGFGIALGAYLIVNLLTTFFLKKNAGDVLQSTSDQTYELV
jgi:hypothetical protein